MPSTVLTPQVIARQALEKLAARPTRKGPARSRNISRKRCAPSAFLRPWSGPLAAELYLSIKKEWHIAQALQLCAILFPRPELEAKAIAALILARYKKEFPPELCGQVKEWLAKNYLDNWASVDTFCPEIMGTLLLRYPELVKEIKTWPGHPNRWVKRASIVSFLKLTKKEGFLDIIYEQAIKLFPWMMT